MNHVLHLKLSRRALPLVGAALLAGCSTMDLPDAPKTIGVPAKPNPHYKVGAPYQIDGDWYVPKADERYVEEGVASWYGDDFHGKLTANGEIFDKRRLSAAHKTLPLPTLAEVENLENGRRVIVRVNDRGPFRDNRVIDMSHAAADALGFTQKGTAKVRVRYVGETEVNGVAALPGDPAATPKRVAAVATSASSEPDELAALIANATGQVPVKMANNSGIPVATALAKIWVELASVDNLAALQTMNLGAPDLGPVSVQSDERAGRRKQSVRIGPFFDEGVAAASLSRALAAGFGGARIVRGGE